MIKEPTVFVLGAGASKPYGFPLGIELVDQVCEQILNKSGTVTAGDDMVPRLKVLGFEKGQAMEFARSLYGAKPYSIDAFLETRREFLGLGKAAIADVLLRAEHGSLSVSVSPETDWYRYLLNRFLLLRNTDYFSVQAKRLSIVTFNFDRSFEHALFQGIKYGFGLTDSEARDLATEIDIHHVHGLLGQPNWLWSGDNATPYGSHNVSLAASCKTAVDQIKIVHEAAAARRAPDRLHVTVAADAASRLDRLQSVPLKFLRFRAIRDRTGLSRSTIWRLERRGEFPRHRRISANAVGWLEQEINDWMLARVEAS